MKKPVEIVECSRGRNHPDGSGAMCRYIADDKSIRTCSAYVGISGRHPQTGEELVDEWRCTDTWIPILLTENARTNRGQTSAIEDLRNIVVGGSAEAQKKIGQAIEDQKRLS
jgi:hypothetical protein